MIELISPLSFVAMWSITGYMHKDLMDTDEGQSLELLVHNVLFGVTIFIMRMDYVTSFITRLLFACSYLALFFIMNTEEFVENLLYFKLELLSALLIGIVIEFSVYRQTYDLANLFLKEAESNVST